MGTVPQMKVAVLGPGGVGGFLAAMLAHAGADVLVLASAATSAGLARDGLQLESARYGAFSVAVRTAARLDERVDAVLVTVKATQLTDALERVPAEALGDAIVVPFLNGLDHVELLRRRYPAGSVVAAAIRIESTKERAGVIRHTSPFAAVELAPSLANRKRAERLVNALSASGVDVRSREDERAVLWDKFSALEPIAMLTTHERAPVGIVRTQHRDQILALVREVAAVATADGVPTDPDKVMHFIDSVPASMESSMQRDAAAGRALEVDALGGALLRRAEKHGIDVPVTRRLVSDLLV
jgi:2-dehydropantoate 2-reductase